MGAKLGKILMLASMAMLFTAPAQASIADDIAFIKSQIRQLEGAGVDASEMRKVLVRMEAEQAAQAARPGQSTPASPQQANSTTLLGSWSHPTKGTWNFSSDGTGTLVRDSVNGIPGRYTITLRWSVEPGNTLVYSPIRNTLVGSPDSDRDEPIANPKTYRAPFEVHGNVLVVGGANYIRK